MNMIGEADHNFITIGDDESLLAINTLIYMNIIFLTGKAGSMATRHYAAMSESVGKP